MDSNATPYAARLEIDYPERLNRLTTLFRIILIIPIGIIIALITATGQESVVHASGEVVTRSSGGVLSGLWLATMLMILFRRRYPRWWFDFARELVRFGARVWAYFTCITDQYPSTVEEQAVHLEIDYPNVEEELNPGLPVVKWLLAIPHYIVLAFLFAFGVIVLVIGWLAVIITGRYPRALFDYVVGVGRWALRVQAYAFLLVTDEYPPFSLR